MCPFSQRKPWQACPSGGKVAKNTWQEEPDSPRGSISAVSEIPTMTPLLFFTGQATALLGPPRLPRGVRVPLRHSAASEKLSPVKLAMPTTHPRSLMLIPCPCTPPAVGKVVTE